MTRHIKSVIVYILLLFSVGITQAQPTSDLLAMVTDELAYAGTTIRPFFADLAYSDGNGIKEYNRLHTGGNSPFNNHPICDETSGKVPKYAVEATSDGSSTHEDSSNQNDHTDSEPLKIEKTGCELLNMLADDFANSGKTLRPFFEDAANAGGKAFKAWGAMIPDELLRKELSWLQKVSDYFTLKPNRLDEFKSHFIIEKGKGRAQAYLKSLTERQTHVGPVYRNQQSSLGYEDFFNNGMTPSGTHDNLLMHTESNTTAGNFISTSLDKDIARQFGSPNGWVFEIRSTKGIDINKTLGADAIHPGQLEVSIPDQVLAKDIKGVWQKEGGVLTIWKPNPNYIP